jgi:lipoprotein-anchoring transpeptidase ErfK/SrfK
MSSQVSAIRPVLVGILAAMAVGSFAADLYGVSTVTSTPAGSTRPAPAPPAGWPAPPQIPGSLVAYATAPNVALYVTRDAPYPVVRLPNPWLLNGDPAVPIQQVFLVVSRPVGGWVEVLLPMRPNGLKAWVKTSAVRLLSDPWRVDVSVRAHLILIHRGAALVYQGPVATGAPATPTPLGEYYVRVLLRTTDPTSVYGPFAYGLSAHSDALTTFNGGDAEIGLHGNDDASALGHSVTHGCVRMDNTEIAALAAVLPLGTPVYIGA